MEETRKASQPFSPCQTQVHALALKKYSLMDRRIVEQERERERERKRGVL